MPKDGRERDGASSPVNHGTSEFDLDDPSARQARLARRARRARRRAAANHDTAPFAATLPAGGAPFENTGTTWPSAGADTIVVLDRQVHQYRIIRELGRGAMGQVFLAEDTRLDRLVAIKFLTRDLDALAERFIVEARATARCHHPNIVVIHEVNEFRNIPFMVLEYLEGQTLRDLIIERAPLSTVRAVEIMIPVARALCRAHELDIVHRDLKPSNVFVTDSGEIKVLDFGIAKVISETPSDSDHTPTDKAIGTMPYMSPEQWGKGAIDHRTDIWAAGIILYEMVAGKHPLGKLTMGNLVSIAALDIPMPLLSADVDDAPAALVELVADCLRKSRQKRISSASQLLARLERLVPGRAAQRPSVAYDPDLVPRLKRDHAELLRMHAELCKTFARRAWDEIPDQVTRFKIRLSAHLLAENTRFYNYLEQAMAGDPDNRSLITDFREEMNEIARTVIHHVKACQNAEISDENAGELQRAFEEIGALLGTRIEREERDLYPLYLSGAW